MSSTPKQHPVIRRLNKAYVQVPPSPLTLTSYCALGTPTHVASSSKLKENTPLRPLQFAMTQSSLSAPLKRKLSSSALNDGPNASAKKTKLVARSNGTPLKARQSNPVVPAVNACPDFPNGYAYCHQCNKKRDIQTTIRCTVVEQYQTARDSRTKERLCHNKYCNKCLRNRYDEDIDAKISRTHGFKSSSASMLNESIRCPRCRGICNCPRCRKAQGLEATGTFVKPAGKLNPDGPKPKKKAKATKIEGKGPSEPKVIVKTLPILKWIPVPVKVSQVEAEERIFIREFMLRFGALMEPSISKSALEELELVGGKQHRNEDEGMTAWVSEVCVKSLVLGLLGLLAKDHDTQVARIIRAAIRDMRSAGVNMNKMWANLASLRDDVANLSISNDSTTDSVSSLEEAPLTFPDPLPAPISAMQNMRSLRSIRPGSDSDSLVYIVQTAQMIPVVVSLIHSVLETAILREEIDQGAKDARDALRDAREATRIENERWEKVRKIMEDTPKDQVDKAGVSDPNRDKRKLHKDQIMNIDYAMKIIGPSFATRFRPLGDDNEGRVYYALSPGVSEREAAFEFLEGAATDKLSKLKKKGRALSTDDRSDLKEWSWFVAVWGKKPLQPGAPQVTKMDIDGDTEVSGDENMDADVEKWWGFWEPDEIIKLADWIAIKWGLEDEETNDSRLSSSSSSSRTRTGMASPNQPKLKQLVTELKDYADLLEWRCRDDKYGSIGKASEPEPNRKGSLGLATIPVEKFYK
ncbi:hypothetical protein B0H34DRAFT_653698 [Crassisporium funariophilum]|nr:hypothetical protein B0H34DRAFT_653698 [Crassisporium funariophilum]